jgi:hypothetical protein
VHGCGEHVGADLEDPFPVVGKPLSGPRARPRRHVRHERVECLDDRAESLLAAVEKLHSDETGVGCFHEAALRS